MAPHWIATDHSGTWAVLAILEKGEISMPPTGGNASVELVFCWNSSVELASNLYVHDAEVSARARNIRFLGESLHLGTIVSDAGGRFFVLCFLDLQCFATAR